MQQYRLVFANADGPLATISFDAADLSAALAKVAEHHANKPVELWRDGNLLGRLEQLDGEEGSYWRLG
jgi:hypothetical protein